MKDPPQQDNKVRGREMARCAKSALDIYNRELWERTRAKKKSAQKEGSWERLRKKKKKRIVRNTKRNETILLISWQSTFLFKASGEQGWEGMSTLHPLVPSLSSSGFQRASTRLQRARPRVWLPVSPEQTEIWKFNLTEALWLSDSEKIGYFMWKKSICTQIHRHLLMSPTFNLKMIGSVVSHHHHCTPKSKKILIIHHSKSSAVNTNIPPKNRK